MRSEENESDVLYEWLILGINHCVGIAAAKYCGGKIFAKFVFLHLGRLSELQKYLAFTRITTVYICDVTLDICRRNILQPQCHRNDLFLDLVIRYKHFIFYNMDTSTSFYKYTSLFFLLSFITILSPFFVILLFICENIKSLILFYDDKQILVK